MTYGDYFDLDPTIIHAIKENGWNYNISSLPKDYGDIPDNIKNVVICWIQYQYNRFKKKQLTLKDNIHPNL